MPIFDLYSESPNPSPEQLLAVCERFSTEVKNKSQHTSWDDHLKIAQHLAEQILGHYQSLHAVSLELLGLRQFNAKLPPAVLEVFLHACAKDHGSLSILIDEIESLYGDEEDRAVESLAKVMWKDGMLSMMPRPSLWDEEGKLRFSPLGFAKIHRDAFLRQMNDWYHKGVLGIQKILDDYTLMTPGSRNIMDETLCRKVYSSVMPDDHPVRALLASKLDNTKDGLFRFGRMFEELDCPDDYTGFEVRLEHAFSLMRSLPWEQASQIVHKAIGNCICDWMSDHGDGTNGFSEPELAVPNLLKVLERARPFGFHALEEVSRNVNYITNQALNKPMIEALLDEGFVEDLYDLDTAAAWKQAALTAADEDLYLSLGLGEKYLVMLLKIKGTPGLREALKKTSAGREAVLGHDLGL